MVAGIDPPTPESGRWSAASRTELLAGQPVPLPAPDTAHQEAVGTLYLALRSWADPAKAGRILLAPVVVQFADVDVVQPDLLFIATERLDGVAADCVWAVPDLVVEVVAPDTADRDRVLKCALYERYGVPEYWIVDPGANTVQILTEGSDGLRPRRQLPFAAVLTGDLTPGTTGLGIGSSLWPPRATADRRQPGRPAAVSVWRRLAASQPEPDGGDAATPGGSVAWIPAPAVPGSPDAAWEAARAAFLQWCRQRDLGARTVAAYDDDVAAFARWYRGRPEAGPLQPAAISVSDILAYRSYMTARYRPTTTNRRLLNLRWFFTVAQARGQVARNPVANIRSVVIPQLGPRSLKREDLRRLLTAAGRSSQRDATLVAVLANTGLRASEALGLTWADVTLSERGTKVIVRFGKGGKYREVPLNLTARSYLRDWAAARWPAGRPPEAPVFTGSVGQPLPLRTLECALVRCSQRAGLDPVATPHTLRHTFCKLLIDLGVPLDRVAALAGHAWLDSTARYTLPTTEDLARDVSRLDWI